MFVTVRSEGSDYEVHIDGVRSGTAIVDLATAIAGTTEQSVVIDGRVVGMTMPLRETGLRNGSLLEICRLAPPQPSGSRVMPEPVRHVGTFNRPPRPIVRPPANILEPPPPPQQPAKPMRFGWAALVVPVVLGLAMAVLLNPRMAIFAVFSPAMLLANWFEDRRRIRREVRETGSGYRDVIDRFAAEVTTAYHEEAAARHLATKLPGELQSAAQHASPRLWERRPIHDDFLVVPIGTGCVPWDPEMVGEVSAEAKAVLDRHHALHDVPVSVELGPGAVCGLAGSRPRLLAVARQILLQAAVNHGPADLAITVFTENPADWDWVKWLPHTLVDGAGRRRIAGTPEEVGQVVALLPAAEGETDLHHLCIVDLPDLSSGGRAAIREVLRAGAHTGVAAVAIASRPLDLPSLATTIVSMESDRCRVRFPDGQATDFSPWLVGAAAARATARALARLDDPEASIAGTSLPAVVHLESLLSLGGEPVQSIQANWQRVRSEIGAPVGLSKGRPLTIDLISDGPHALLGGTTGAGKSELLRTLVASLAATMSPTALNFVLVDYKGGSAFDACADLPHTVGLVTDLDEHLAERALTCLDAELTYREQRLREAGASDIGAFPPSATDPLPRLLVVVDEFAALAKELPQFIDALVGIAQRGRSLGVHMLLATQRPSGVISENIRANTNLRIALRMQDAADSVDVIGCGDAATIGRNQPGRGLARYGPSDVVPFQTALVTGHAMSGRATGLRVRPFLFVHEQQNPASAATMAADEPTDLERIVKASREAAKGLPTARLPWPPALPAVVHLDVIGADQQEHGATVFGLADEPHRQRQVPATWSPVLGNLLLYGLSGSGTTTALLTLAVGLAAASDPDRLHINAMDFDDQALHPLHDLPHVGAVVGANDRERQLRLLRRLAEELQNRRRAVADNATALVGHPTIVTLVDNYGGFGDAFGDPGDIVVQSLLVRLVADGPGVDMLTIITAKHPGDVPTRLVALVPSRLVFRLADRYDYSGLGIPPVEPPSTPGRAFESGSGREIQVALPHSDGLPAALHANRWGAPVLAPWTIEVLPSEVSLADVAAAGSISPSEWFLPLGIGDTALTPAGLVLREGEHALITGPPRSGKSTALATVAAVAKAANPNINVVAVLPRQSPLRTSTAIDEIVEPDCIDSIGETDDGRLLLVDDAELVGESAYLSELIRSRRSDTKVVAAGSADAMRSLYGHWTQEIRRSRIGCALRPNVATDGDLWQTQLPRRGPDHFPVGRGYLLADGRTELVQLGRK
jgi:S-DNA-T family DNA segregation ATPase FtsK/SpoIIIE